MSGLLNTLSSAFVGLMLAGTNFAPIVGWQRFLENRNRVFNAVLLFSVSFLLLLAALFLGTIDVVVQFEDQGLLFWNPILTTVSVLAVLGLTAGFAGRACLPKAKDYVVFDGTSPVERFLAEMRASAASAPAPSEAPLQPVSDQDQDQEAAAGFDRGAEARLGSASVSNYAH